jgi:S-adenosylmethionine-diacylglycerol 3-amino-3-carboxypropyl transferase
VISKTSTRSVVGDRMSFAQSWEDPLVLGAGLKVGSDDDVLSICGAGDNSFALAIAGARSVTVIDRSASQLALAKLKLAAAKHFDLARFHSFLGLSGLGQRVHLYHALRGSLDDETLSFWDANEGMIREGLVGCGKFEHYLGLFRDRMLPLVHRRATVEAFLDCSSLDAQREFFEQRWNSLRWRALFRVFFSQAVMARSGRSAAEFKYVEGPVSSAFLARTAHVMTEIPVATNPFLQWIMAGRYRDLEDSHPYLSAAGHAALATAADRIHFVKDDLVAHLGAVKPGTYSAFNLSDIPEYLSEAETEALLRACVSASAPGGRLAYWNLLVPRWRPDAMAELLERDTALGATLIRADRAFVYGAFQVETVR